MENIHVSGVENLDVDVFSSNQKEMLEVENWAIWREEMGMLGALDETFYEDVWKILQQCKGLVIGDKYSTQSRIGSELTLESTAGERSFDLKIDTLLQSISIPAYKKLNIELIKGLIKLFQANPELHIQNDLVLDVLIGHAVRIAWMKKNENGAYDEHKGEAWSDFYTLSLDEAQENFIEAFSFLMQEKGAK